MIDESIRSLQLVVPNRISNKNNEISNTIDWLFDILRICPLMEEITIYNALSLSPSHHASQYPSLKKLTIYGVKCDKSLNFLNYISSRSKCTRLDINCKSLKRLEVNKKKLVYNLAIVNIRRITYKRKNYVRLVT